MRKCRDRWGIATGSLVLAAASRAGADVRSWDANGASPANGNFNIAGNWSPDAIPGAADGAIFRLGAGQTYTVTFTGIPLPNPARVFQTDFLRVGANTVTFHPTQQAVYNVLRTTTDEGTRGVIVGELAGETAILNLQLPLNATAATLGDGGGSNGTINLSGPLTISGNSGDDELIVGNSGSGALAVATNARLKLTGAGGNAVLGKRVGSSGVVTVVGAGASWTMATGELTVGGSGTGSLTIGGGGQVNQEQDAVVGRDVDSFGTATVDGVGSAWTLRLLTVGDRGTGTLNVSNGGRITSVETTIGRFATSPGGTSGASTLNVSGGGSMLVAQGLRVGVLGLGTLHVSDGGQVSSQVVLAGRAANIVVEGAGSTWTNPSSVTVEDAGNLRVQGGGRVESGPVVLGATPFSLKGSAVVDGAGSLWTVNGGLTLRTSFATFNDVSKLTVSNGGTLSVAGDVTGGAGQSQLVLDGGTVDLQNHVLGGAGTARVILNLRAGTLKNFTQVNGGAGLSKPGNGTLILDGALTYTGPTDVQGGMLVFKTSHVTGSALVVQDGASARLAAGAETPHGVVLKTASVNTNSTGKLDVTDNKLVVAGGDVAGITSLVKQGFGSGTWDGAGGIMTSVANSKAALGVARADEVGLGGLTFGDVPVVGSDVLVMYTLAGDADLNARVDFFDLVRLAQNYNSAAESWPTGDFNYDGRTNFADLVKLAQNYNQALPVGALPGASAEFEGDLASAFAQVPEPTGAGVIMAISALAGPRRRAKPRSGQL